MAINVSFVVFLFDSRETDHFYQISTRLSMPSWYNLPGVFLVNMVLTKHEAGRISNGPVLGTGPVYRYRVGGLPRGQEADLAEFNHSWHIFRVKHGVQGHWTGTYASADDPLAALQQEFDGLRPSI